MKRCWRSARTAFLSFERCEDRNLTTLIFVFNGNAFLAARPGPLTANAEVVLRGAGHRAIQLATPEMSSPGAFRSVVRQVASLSHGQPIGIVGFSAGGSLALRLAGVPALHVKDVLDYYGPPDLRDYLDFHHGDRFYRRATARIHFTPATIDLFSGAGDTSAHVVGAFGLKDGSVTAAESMTSLRRDFPQGQTYAYPGSHGVSINASPPALDDFLAHL